MASMAGVYFLVVEHHSSGAAIFLHKFAQIPSVYVGIGLYMWTGLLLARTRVASLVFAVVTPLRLPPAALAVVVVVLSAWPVAWSGASGIFVVAVGSVVFRELRAAGASRSLATAVTAMAGSLGVVLRPCLVVVLVATLNTDVTTDELYNRGRFVFVLTSVLTALAFFVWHRVWPAPASTAVSSSSSRWSASLTALRALAGYVVLAVVVLGACWLVLGADLNEHTAPLILPMVVLAWIAFEARRDVDVPSVLTRLQTATADTSGTLGALLLMMCGSVALGGVVERADVMRVLPSSFASPVAAMAVVIVLLVLIGMFMDELGAVVLVSVTLAPIARASGIDPVHFWLVVLVGFELGYLAPPVALNQLLARQIIATIDEEHGNTDEPAGPQSWWQRHAHVLMPASVMATALVIVAFAPFVWALL
jgi:TRAP-type C4-dicarboxylate transport system permease large subunit